MKIIKRLGIIVVILLILVAFSYQQNNSVQTNTTTITSQKIPPSMNGLRILHLSDLHNKTYGQNQGKLVSKVKMAQPDLIVFTGDMIHNDATEENGLHLMKQLIKIAPVYFVMGNHEGYRSDFNQLEDKLVQLGVTVLRNELVTIQNGIQLIGIDDPTASVDLYTEDTQIVDQELQKAIQKGDNSKGYKILLSHRPELLFVYAKHNIDLVLSGHAHGGQVRLPFVGGIIAPNQGFFPEFDAGEFRQDHTTLIVNRGLGNSIIPQRLFNLPEIILIELKSTN
ncbi:MAG TPA: phosphoesterase [Paenibacillaceae bacterium]|nr:phosphoesterase [Paenibacillaceae bacterium]